MEAKRVADVDAATADLFSDIDSMTEELLRGKMERAAAKGPVSSGDKDADAALAAAEAKVAAARAARAARGAGGVAAASTTCVVVAAAGSSSGEASSPGGPVAVDLAEQLKRDRGWTVLPLTLPLDSASAISSAPATDEATAAAIAAACATGACVVVCPELPGSSAEGDNSGGKKSGGGGFFRNLMKMKDQASSESLAPIDSRALAAAFKVGCSHGWLNKLERNLWCFSFYRQRPFPSFFCYFSSNPHHLFVFLGDDGGTTLRRAGLWRVRSGWCSCPRVARNGRACSLIR